MAEREKSVDVLPMFFNFVGAFRIFAGCAGWHPDRFFAIVEQLIQGFADKGARCPACTS